MNNPNFKLFSIQGHPNSYQHATGEFDYANATGVPMIDIADELELSDIDIDKVSEEKKHVPILTKKGKMIIGAIIVAWGLWYIYKRYQASKEQGNSSQNQNNSSTSNESNNNSSEEGNSNNAVNTEKANQTMSSLTNEDGVVGVEQ